MSNNGLHEQDEPRPLTAGEFRDVIGRFASGVTVITTSENSAPYGTTASAFSSLSLEPPMVLVCVNKSSATGEAIERTGRFAVNILAEDQADLALRFARKGDDKFEGVQFARSPHGLPVLNDALATLESRVTETVTGGTHNVFLAQVEHATGRTGSPLAYFRGQFGRLELAQGDRAYSELHSLILHRDIAVDQPLEPAQLAETLGVPVASISHALARLGAEGLVDREDDGTYAVRAVTLDAVVDALRARSAMVVGATTLDLDTVSDAAIAECRRHAEAAAPRADADEAALAAWSESRVAFADALMRLGGTTTLADAFRRADTPAMILRLWRDVPARADANDVERVRAAYLDLVDGLEQRDPVAIVEAARGMLAANIDLYTAMFAAHSRI